jgi:acetyltransferase-like isoleucine patch superfamily enzyme
MSRLFQLMFQRIVLRIRHRRAGLRIGYFSVCDDVHFGRQNVIHNLVRMRAVSLGDFTYVANGARIVNARIGKFCSLGPECRIGLGTHPMDFVSTHPAFYSSSQPTPASLAVREFIESRTVEIGNDVWVGDRAIIRDGVRIGDGAIVGAAAVVTRDVAPYAIVAGVPAKVIRRRFDDGVVEQLLASRWWDRDLDWIRANAPAFADPGRFLELVGTTPRG